MTISIACASCGKSLNVPESLAGKLVKCPACSNSVQVPIPTESPDHDSIPYVLPDTDPKALRQLRSKECPFCGEEVLAVAKKCKHCGQTIDVTLRAAEEATRSKKQTLLIVACIGGGLMLFCAPILIIIVIGAITTLGENANKTFMSVGQQPTPRR